MVWGLVVAFVGTLAMAVSLAEICHVYPLSGGQYDWSCECPCMRRLHHVPAIMFRCVCAGAEHG